MNNQRPLIFVSGPVSGDPYGAIPNGVAVFDELWEQGWAPILPQLSVIHNMISPREYEEWMEYFDSIIIRCDALYRMKGESAGADREVQRAQELGIKLYFQN